MAVGLLCAIVFAGGLGALAIRNTGRIDEAQRAAERIERIDNRALRDAAWRGCARSMLDRAEQYVTNAAVLKVPAFASLFPRQLIERSIARRRARLPILDCDPNLCGRPPTVMPERAQEGFIAAYARGLLPANPQPPKPDGHCSMSE